MFMTNKNEIISYDTAYRLWQGIPEIEITKMVVFFLFFIQVEQKKK